MGKSVYIAEKPSVAQEFAKALHVNFTRKDGYLEGGDHIVTWCVGHLVTMSYPDAYDPNLKRWSFDTLPFLPTEFKYEVIESAKKQYTIVSSLLNRPMLRQFMSAPTPEERENTSIVWWSRCRAYRTRNGNVYGSTPRRRKKSYVESGRQKISQPTTIWEMLPICGPRKIISWVSIFPEP